MKLEKINPNKVRCLISQKELLSRSITTADELSYGSPKVKQLFNDVMSRVGQVMDIEEGRDLLSIEAVPTEDHSLCLIITKTDSHDELDGRFAEFTNDPLAYIDDSLAYTDDDAAYTEPVPDYLAILIDSPSSLVKICKQINTDLLTSSTYLIYKGKHILCLELKDGLLDSPVPTSFLPYLVEHCNFKAISAYTYLRMREHGNILINKYAVETMSKL